MLRVLIIDFIGAAETCFAADDCMLDAIVLSWLVIELCFLNCRLSILERKGALSAFRFLSITLLGDSS